MTMAMPWYRPNPRGPGFVARAKDYEDWLRTGRTWMDFDAVPESYEWESSLGGFADPRGYHPVFAAWLKLRDVMNGYGEPGMTVCGLLVSPLAEPLRETTPHGFFGSPRFSLGIHSSARPFYEGQEPDHLHQGVDLVASPGEYVYAGVRGKAVKVPPGSGGIVVAVKVDSPDGEKTIVFADLGAALVRPGDLVTEETPIGIVAPRGFVHVAVHDDMAGRFVDPKGLVSYAY